MSKTLKHCCEQVTFQKNDVQVRKADYQLQRVTAKCCGLQELALFDKDVIATHQQSVATDTCNRPNRLILVDHRTDTAECILQS